MNSGPTLKFSLGIFCSVVVSFDVVIDTNFLHIEISSVFIRFTLHFDSVSVVIVTTRDKQLQRRKNELNERSNANEHRVASNAFGRNEFREWIDTMQLTKIRLTFASGDIEKCQWKNYYFSIKKKRLNDSTKEQHSQRWQTNRQSENRKEKRAKIKENEFEFARLFRLRKQFVGWHLRNTKNWVRAIVKIELIVRRIIRCWNSNNKTTFSPRRHAQLTEKRQRQKRSNVFFSFPFSRRFVFFSFFFSSTKENVKCWNCKTKRNARRRGSVASFQKLIEFSRCHFFFFRVSLHYRLRT